MIAFWFSSDSFARPPPLIEDIMVMELKHVGTRQSAIYVARYESLCFVFILSGGRWSSGILASRPSVGFISFGRRPLPSKDPTLTPRIFYFLLLTLTSLLQ